MNKFLIATASNDIHAVVVAQALLKLGLPCFRWVTSDYPTAQRCTVTINGGAIFFIDAVDGCLKLDLSESGLVFWNRRVVRQHHILDELCGSDRIVAARESEAFVQATLALLDVSARSVNSIYAAKRAESKPYQLLMAKGCGLNIPETTITNNPEKIRFLVEKGPSPVLSKPFSPTVWKGHETDFVTRSAVVDRTMLPGDQVLQACPVILQPYVEKNFEVRITCFGNLAVAVRIDSQSTPSARVDWRAVSPARLGIVRIEIPSAVERGCLRLLTAMGLEFGCIDMVVTPDGDWVFLEINQMGQFLWIEQISPDIPMLDLFVQLLTGTRKDGGTERLYGFHYGDFAPAAAAEIRAERDLRSPKIGASVVDEVRSTEMRG